MQDGPRLYAYAGQNVLGTSDWNGLQASLACVLGGPVNPACDAGLVVDAITIGIGICAMARNESGQRNYIYYEAKMRPDPCAWLEEEYNKARASGDLGRAGDIVTAQKVLKCRNIRKRN